MLRLSSRPPPKSLRSPCSGLPWQSGLWFFLPSLDSSRSQEILSIYRKEVLQSFLRKESCHYARHRRVEFHGAHSSRYRLRPPACAFLVFAARRRAEDRASSPKLAPADKQPALALTDTNNLFGALEFSEKLAGTGIQPIAGVQLSVCFEEPDPAARLIAPAVANIVLLAQTEEGYRNLMRLGQPRLFRRAARRGAAPCGAGLSPPIARA